MFGLGAILFPSHGLLFMESTNSSVNLTRRKKFKNNLSTLLIAGLILWTPVLVGLTFKYQTSCPEPMLAWSEQAKQLSKDCQSQLSNHQETENSNTEFNSIEKDGRDEPETPINHNSIGKDVKDEPETPINPDIAGLIVGTATGAVVTALGAPVVAVAGAAVAAWFIIRTILNH